MDNKYSMLNDRQREAVFHTEGPLLILAGAGAGKTRVLTHRIAYLIEEKQVDPWNIMAITFTNKAAEEMKNRVVQMVEYGDSVWVSTFHSSCVRILRRHIDRLGYDTDFTIYDTDDQKTVVRHVIKELDLDTKVYKERALLTYISDCKNEMLSPDDMEKEATNYRDRKYAEIYREYQNRLKKNNACDFDDLLLLTVELFKAEPQVLEYYQNRFRYIMVDEYQDTNQVQFQFVWLLSKAHKNICVVGDDDQSIYKFRGADIRNILDFEAHFEGTKVVKLEQNYRSTSSILNCANAVIQNNRGRKEKRLWSDLGTGDQVEFRFYEDAYEEADEVIRKVRKENINGAAFKDFAVLYRTNAQSRLFEEKCITYNIPYRMVGGVNFYQREEIKDLLAYLKAVSGGRDDIAVQRIINKPKRGIGQATIDKLLAYAARHDMSLMQAIRTAASPSCPVPGTERAVKKLAEFAHLCGRLSADAEDLPFDELIRKIIDETDYYSTLEDKDEEQQEQKKENIEELISKAHDFQENWDGEEAPELADFLEEVALVADIDSVSDDDDKMLLMTLHGSKGLEFDTVFLCGLEEGLFPSFMSMESGDTEEVEEERRLCYVGITRAKKHLYISGARRRTRNGETMYSKVSRFVEEMPPEITNLRRSVERKYTAAANEPKKESFSFGGYGGREDFGSSFSGGYGSSRYGSGGSSSGSSGSDSRFGISKTQKPAFGKTFEVKKMPLDYTVGDRIRHSRFGEGTVLLIEDGKRDYTVTIQFDEYGVKKMMPSTCKIEKI